MWSTPVRTETTVLLFLLMMNNQLSIPRGIVRGGILPRKGEKQMQNRKTMLTAGILSGGLLVTGLILAVVTLRSLGDILLGLSAVLGEDTANTMGAIFSQIKDATLHIHILIPLVVAGGLFWLCRSVRGCKGRILCGFCAFLAFLVIYASALLLTRVNDIRFIDLLLLLAKSVSDGLFDSL